MSEQLTVLFEQLRGSQPPTPFAPPDQVRRRGRQRNHRQALAAGSAVLAVAGLGTGWAVGAASDPTPPPVSPAPPQSLTPAPSLTHAPPQSLTPAPSLTHAPPTTVNSSRLLKPEDFAAIDGVEPADLDDQGPNGPEWPWMTAMTYCPDYRAADYPTITKRHDARGLSYSKDTWISWEIVESYPDAVANMADVRRAIATCPTYQFPDGPEIQQTVVAEQFAGEDSLLVRVKRGSARTDYMVVVRVGALVATLAYMDGPEPDARAMADAMAARLR